MILRSRRSLRLLASLVLAVVVAGCAGPGPTTSSASGSPRPVGATPGAPSGSPGPAVVGRARRFVRSRRGSASRSSRSSAGSSDPLAVTHAGDGSGRLFVAEQGGRIRIVRDGTLVDEPFLDISERISAGGERGLLGLAFHPDFPTDPRFFVNYTDPNGDTRISSFTVDPANPDRADPGSEVRLVSIDQPYPNHNGGALAFGPGRVPLHRDRRRRQRRRPPRQRPVARDAPRQDPPDRRRPDRGRPGLRDPADNPFAGQAGALPEIFVFGMRNPWRMSFDRVTGDLWIGDVGPGRAGRRSMSSGPGRRARTSAGT